MATNYGFNIGGGGISDLVKPIDVKPVRGMQFAPTPALRTTPQKEPKKALQGALLGAISPLLGEAAVKGLGSLPGLENLLYQKDQKTLEELGVKKPTLGLEKSKVGIDPFLEEAKKRRDLVDAALPAGDIPRQKTLLGKALTEALTYAPAAFLDDEGEGGVAEFISTAGAGRKVRGALDEARLEAYLDRQTERGKKLADIGDFERKVSYSAELMKDGSFSPVKRTVLISPDKTTRYVLSAGNPKIDFIIDSNGKQVPVPKNQHYIRESLTLDDNDPGKPKDVKLYNTTNGDIAYGTVQFMQTPQGRDSRVMLLDPRNRDGKREKRSAASLASDYNDNWVPYDQELADLDSREKGDPQLVKRFDGRRDREIATMEVANIAADLLPITIEGETNPELLADAGALAGTLDTVGKNINALYNLFERNGKSVGDIIYDQAGSAQAAVSMNKLLIASNDYNTVMTSSSASAQDKAAARTALTTALKEVQTNSIDQGTSNAFTSLDLESDEFQDILEKRGMLAAGQLRLAYAAAAADGQTGTSLSDKDVANFLEQVGFGQQNARAVGKKIANFVKGRFQTFDSGEFRKLSNNARVHDETAIRKTNNELIGTFGVDAADLNTLSDPQKTAEEKQAAENRIQQRISMVTRGGAFSDFDYDEENQRYRYVPILERLGEYQQLYNKYLRSEITGPKGKKYNGFFEYYGISEDDINLEGPGEIPTATGRLTRPTNRRPLRIRP